MKKAHSISSIKVVQPSLLGSCDEAVPLPDGDQPVAGLTTFPDAMGCSLCNFVTTSDDRLKRHHRVRKL